MINYHWVIFFLEFLPKTTACGIKCGNMQHASPSKVNKALLTVLSPRDRVITMPRRSDPNRCRASEIEPLAVSRPRRAGTVPQTPELQVRPARPSATQPTDHEEAKETRIHADDAKKEMFRRYAAWIASGKKRADSPIDDLVNEYECDRHHPKRLYDKVLENGTVENQWDGGRPESFSPECWNAMVDIVRSFRTKQRKASTRVIAATLKKQRKKAGKKAPSHTAVAAAKKELGFVKHKVKTKPKLSSNLWKQREQMAKERVEKDLPTYVKKNARRVFADEKWSSEEKGTVLEFEARKESPVPANIRFKAKDAETRTQLIKIMFVFCVTSTDPIGYWELDFKKWNKEKQQKTKGGKDATGITAAFMKPILKKVAAKARRVLGKGKITFLHDKAPCYQSLIADQTKTGESFGFDSIEMSAGKAPDMSHLDAGVCPFMEREVEQAGAQTAEDIRAAVKRAWAKITPAMCRAISARVSRAQEYTQSD